MSQAMQHPDRSSETARFPWRWPALVVGLLLFCVGTQTVLLCCALGDPNFRVEPDYYRRALEWDARQAPPEGAR